MKAVSLRTLAKHAMAVDVMSGGEEIHCTCALCEGGVTLLREACPADETDDERERIGRALWKHLTHGPCANGSGMCPLADADEGRARR